jgi:hypothetical protein
VFLTIAILVALTIAIAARAVAPGPPDARRLSQSPDRPMGFGSAMVWMAVRSRDTTAVVEELGVVAPEPCNWRSGIGTVYDHQLGTEYVFVSPPVNGWTFVAGLALPRPAGRASADKCAPLLEGIGRRFVEVQYFAACPSLDFFAWARLLEGRWVRAFAIGDAGIIWNRGRATGQERTLGLKLFDFRGVRGRKGDAGGEMILYPTQEHVLHLARSWSLDPMRLGEVDVPSPALGYIALAPAAWRPDRLRRTG